MSTDAALGNSRTSYRSAVTAIAKCDAGEIILVRFEGTVKKAHTASKTGLTRRAKEGSCL